MGNGAISDISGVVRNCEEALKVAEDMAGVNARQVVVGLAGELVKGKTTTVTYKRPNPKQNITMVELEHIMQKIQDRAMARAKAELSWELGNDDVEVLLAG